MTRIQKAFIAAAASAALGASTFGIGSAFAAEKAGHPGIDNLVEAIATKFNLDKDEVQKVFDEQRALGEAERKAQFAEHSAALLTKAVEDGKLTQAQADLITAKRAELEANKPDFTGKTPAEIREALKTQGDAVRDWAEANDIPEQFLLGPGPIIGHFRGGMMGEFRGPHLFEDEANESQIDD